MARSSAGAPGRPLVRQRSTTRNNGSAAASQGLPTPKKRLTASARRSSILAAARRAFSETGDVNGTTVKTIAEFAGISEGVIYRHFESKDQLFLEAIVEPLHATIMDMVTTMQEIGRDLTQEQRDEVTALMFKRLAKTFSDILPLLGLVLFGDPVRAKTFYANSLARAMDELGAAWQDFFDDYGLVIHKEAVTRSVFGISLMLALDKRFRGSRADVNRTARDLTEITRGFFPPLSEFVGKPRKRKA